MNKTPWKQVNITYPGADPRERERHAIAHLANVLPAAEADGLITAWFFIRKGHWRIRYLLAEGADEAGADPLHPCSPAGSPGAVTSTNQRSTPSAAPAA